MVPQPLCISLIGWALCELERFLSMFFLASLVKGEYLFCISRVACPAPLFIIYLLLIKKKEEKKEVDFFS